MAGSVASTLLLLLNMAGSLLAPRAPLPQIPPASAAEGDDVDFFFFPFLVLYKSGRVERFMGTDTVPASVDPATGVASKDVAIDDAPSSAGLAVRIYLPTLSRSNGTAKKLPLVVFFHGGGFVTESAFSPTYQRYLNALAAKAGALVVSVDYHLSPEHRLPTGYDDAWAALQWALTSARSGSEAEPWLHRHADLARLFLIGDSAGGNIAHNLAIRAGKQQQQQQGGLGLGRVAMIKGLALLDPYFLGPHADPGAERAWGFICAGRYGTEHPYVNPMASLPAEAWRRGLGGARVLMTVSGQDRLGPWQRAYVDALRASGWGGDAQLYETPGEGHCYFLNNLESPKAAMHMATLAAFVNRDD